MACDGRDPIPPPRGIVTGVLLRELDIATLVTIASSDRPFLAVDIDTVEGLNADTAGARFVVGRLGIGIVATRRPALAAWIATQGAVALLHVLAFDSTGLGRSLDAHPGEGVGTLVSPGPVVAHLSAEDRTRMYSPVVAYGLIDAPERALAMLEIADAIVVSAECGAALAARDPS